MRPTTTRWSKWWGLWESELHKVRKKHPDKEVIHGQPVEEVAMDTVRAERWSCTEAGRDKEKEQGQGSLGYDLHYSRLSVRVQRSQPPGVLRGCCSRCWLQSWWKLWEWQCHRGPWGSAWSHNMGHDEDSREGEWTWNNLLFGPKALRRAESLSTL